MNAPALKTVIRYRPRQKAGNDNGQGKVIQLPVFHADQVNAFNALYPYQRGAIRAGRRWGKTEVAKTWAVDVALKGGIVGWFAPNHKTWSQAFNEIVGMLGPLRAASSKTHGQIYTTSGGMIEFWTLENEMAGRSRKYHLVVIDEGAFAGDMMSAWSEAIEPTLLDYGGRCLVCSNTNGVDSNNFFWRICNQKEHGFVEYHAPTFSNPLLPLKRQGESTEQWERRRRIVFEKLKAQKHPLVFRQEYLAEFVDWSGVAFFSREKMLDNGRPVEMPAHCDYVFAVVDTAAKTGAEHDGTAVTYYAKTRASDFPLLILDWEIAKIEGAFLADWFPAVMRRLEELAKLCGARLGALGTWIEDKSTGTTLLQSARARGWPVEAISTKLTAMGKDERAIAASDFVHNGKVKFTQPAFDKTMIYNGQSANHLLQQVVEFRVGDPEWKDREDDLLDAFCYGISIGLGNSIGF